MWDRILGHAAVKAELRARLRAQRLPHALLFLGVQGIGKCMVAKVLARTLLCANGGDAPCGVCASCRAMETGTHPDFLYLAPTVRSKGSAMIRMEDMQAALTSLSRKPTYAEQFVAIIDDADRMNDVAANRLLKTLEEPQGDVTFILVAGSRAGLLSTIVSRTMPVRFGVLSAAETIEVLQREGLTRARAVALAPLALGSPGRALVFHEGQGEKGRALASGILNLLPTIRDSDIWSLGEEAHALTREEAAEALRVLSLCLRDMLVLTMDGEAELYFVERKESYIAGLAAGMTQHRIEMCMEHVMEAIRRQSSNVATRLLFEGLLLRMQ